MGYDAYIRCDCFKKGKAKPFKYIQYVVDEPEGLELRLPTNIKGTPLEYTIQEAFDEWEWNPCEHEYQEYYSDRICNVCGMAHFRSTLDMLNAETTLPTLYKYLPSSNSGFLPFEENDNFKNDLLKMKNMGSVRCLNLILEDGEGNEKYIQHAINSEIEYFGFLPECNIGLNRDNFFIVSHDKIVFESDRFSVEKENDTFVFRDDEQKKSFSCPVFKWGQLEINHKVNMYTEEIVESINEAHGYIIDTLLTLIEKSNEIGNPICWA